MVGRAFVAEAVSPADTGGGHRFSQRRGDKSTVALADDRSRQAGLMRRHDVQVSPHRSSFAGFRFPSEVIIVAVRWYLRYGLSYRDVEELLAE